MIDLKLTQKKIDRKNMYYYDEKYFKVLNNIILSNYEIITEFKNDNRTYVAKIRIDKEEYILKKIYTNKIIKKILSIFKDGEALTILKNVNKVIRNGITELAEPIGIIVERKNKIIRNEILVMRYYNGERLDFRGYVKFEEGLQVLSILDKIYSLGRFHGDCSPTNFHYCKDKKIIVLDTKLKKMFFGDYRKHYDVLTFMKYLYPKIDYPYKKNIFYYFAYLVRKIRDKKRERDE